MSFSAYILSTSCSVIYPYFELVVNFIVSCYDKTLRDKVEIKSGRPHFIHDIWSCSMFFGARLLKWFRFDSCVQQVKMKYFLNEKDKLDNIKQ